MNLKKIPVSEICAVGYYAVKFATPSIKSCFKDK